MVAAVSGFLLTVVIGRGLGAEGAGVVYAGVALASVLIVLSTVGTETALVWAIPRAKALERAYETHTVLRWAFGPVLAVSMVLAAGLFVSAPLASQALADDSAAATTAFRVFALGVLLGGPTVLAVQATRALGGIRPFVMLQQVSLPLLRLGAVTVLVLLGVATVFRVAWAWALPLLFVGIAAGIVTWRRKRVIAGGPAIDTERRPVKEFWSYALRRAVGSIGSQLLTWSDVIIVAALSSPSVAGVYATASRFATSGRIALEASRLAIAPQVSQHFARRAIAQVSALAEMSATWAVAVSWPLYLTLAAFSGTVLSIFGPEFSDGAQVLTLLCLGMMYAVGTGNVGMMLNMSGRSGLLAVNVWSALATNVVLNLILVPRYGAIGAGVAWVAALLVENTFGLVQTWRMGVRAHRRPFALVAVVVGVVTAVVLLVARLALGDTWGGLAAAVLGLSVALPIVFVRLRSEMHLDAFMEGFGRRLRRSTT